MSTKIIRVGLFLRSAAWARFIAFALKLYQGKVADNISKAAALGQALGL